MSSYPSCIHWLPAIELTGFRCTVCGTKVWEDDETTQWLDLENKPLSERPVGRCKMCGSIVCTITEDNK